MKYHSVLQDCIINSSSTGSGLTPRTYASLWWTTETFPQPTRELHSSSQPCCTITGTISFRWFFGDLCSARKRKIGSGTQRCLAWGTLSPSQGYLESQQHWHRICMWVAIKVLGSLFGYDQHYSKGGSRGLNMLLGCSIVLIPRFDHSMFVAKFWSSHCVVGYWALTASCERQWAVVTWPLAVTLAKRYIWFGWAKYWHGFLPVLGDALITK